MSLLYKHCSGPPCVTVNQVTPLHDQLLHVNSTLRFAIKYSSNLICSVSSFHSPPPSLVPCASGKQLFKCAPPKATTAHVQNHSSKICIAYSTSQWLCQLQIRGMWGTTSCRLSVVTGYLTCDTECACMLLPLHRQCSTELTVTEICIVCSI